ncbi:MAG: hypothetical protein JF887_07745, partial [Candidatus Dormibacteraeota bacterium]|nr:hypothetical protein [Candidatus Dormibacteraeota bacterium]
MTTRGDTRSGSRRTTGLSRVAGGAASTLVIGGAIMAGGAATLITASAHHLGTPATTPITSGTASNGGFVVGTAVLNDSASLLKDVTADRKVKFELWGPSNPTCSATRGAPVFQQTVAAVQGPGTVRTTGGYTGTAPQPAQTVGTYQWTALVIAPDGTVEDSSTCGSEPVKLVTAPTPTPTPTPTPPPTPTPTPTPPPPPTPRP